ncbi:MAG: PAS domain-containing sensor histidine kinase [Candidatus Uhrbacteria bacterium]|nr:PAS domain-containing sensor histidine kinase [Candidatus Uhrbacteria bacterium]
MEEIETMINVQMIKKKKSGVIEKLKQRAKQLATTAKEEERIRRKLVVTAKEKERIRRKLVVTAKNLENARIATRNVLEDLWVEKERLTETNAKDEAMLASIGDGLVATDKEGRITLVNDAFEKILGWDQSEVKGKLFSEVVHMADEFGKELAISERLLTKVLKGHTTTTTTTTTGAYQRKDGAFFPVAFTIAPIIVDAKIAGVVEVFRDITHEKELDRMKSEFIAIASHQLRTPLTSIQWVVERFTKKEALTPKGKEYLNDIHLSVKRLNELVDLLLNLSRIEEGKVGITPEPVEVIGFVKSFLSENVPLQDKKGLKVVFEDHPVELRVKTDKSALRNIVQGVFSNALEYTPAGGRIDVSIQKNDDIFVIKIKDTGIGIPKAEQSHIFEKFVRANNAKLYKTDGTGIGLYIAKRATDLLGGEIRFESEEGKGSTFFVSLPLQLLPEKGEKQQ